MHLGTLAGSSLLTLSSGLNATLPTSAARCTLHDLQKGPQIANCWQEATKGTVLLWPIHRSLLIYVTWNFCRGDQPEGPAPQQGHL